MTKKDIERIIGNLAVIIDEDYSAIHVISITDDGLIVSDSAGRVKITVSPEQETVIHVRYDYQALEEDYSVEENCLDEVFSRMSEDAGMILEIGDSEYYWESMEDYYAGILSCLSSSCELVRLPIDEHLKKLRKEVV